MPNVYSFPLILSISSLIAGLYWVGLINNAVWFYPLILLFIGALLGISLNYFHFGFSSSFRSLIVEKRTAGMRSIVIMLALAVLLFSGLMHFSSNQQTHIGFIRPLSLSIPLGAFLFGIGMQISCGCTSGTLNRLGQLQPLALPTLLFMIIGGTLAAMSFEYWRHLPAIEPFAFQNEFSWLRSLAIQALILGLLFLWLLRIEKQNHRKPQKLIQFNKLGQLRRLQHWHPLLLAGLSLAVLNSLLFLVSGSPWSISSVFPFWGTKLMNALALPIDWAFWDYALENQNHLALGVFEYSVSLTTLGVFLGALGVTLLRGLKTEKCAKKALLLSSLGGLIMGFSAVLASGCNIGAFFSGIASGSLHGWVWLLFAFMGNYIGIALRQKYL